MAPSRSPEESSALCVPSPDDDPPQQNRLLSTTHNTEKRTEKRGHKTSLFLDFCRQLSLSTVFRLIGEAIGTYPMAFLISALILCSSSVGMFWLHLRDNVRDGFTPTTSASKYEMQIYREFLNSAGDPAMTTVLFRAFDGGSMHRFEYLGETVKLLNMLKSNMTTEYEGQLVKYSQFCGHYCNANDPVDYFYRSLVDKTADPNMTSLKLNYPIASLYGFELHLERNFYAVRTNNNNNSVTNIEHIELIVASFMGEMKTPVDERKMAAWEMAVFEYTRTRKQGEGVEMLVIGSEICDVVMNREAQRMAPYFAVGFGSMFVFVFTTVYFSACYFRKLTWYTIVVALASTIVPVVAITSTLGLNSLAGFRTNQLLLIMPFLIMGIGVNDSFLTVHAWMRQSASDPIAIRMGRVFEEVGPSITTTTLTNVITFFIGAFTPTPEISLFCFGTAIALGFAYIYTLILFGPILYYASPVKEEKISHEETVDGWREKLNVALDCIMDWYCTLISSKIVALILFLGTIVYWYFAILGTLKIDSRLDTGKILPKEAPIRRPNRMIEESVWSEYYPVTVIVNNPLDIRDETQLHTFHRMVAEFEGMPTCRGHKFTISWLRDYEAYSHGIAKDVFDYYSDTFEEVEEGLSYTKLNGFLGSPQYAHFKTFMNINKNESIVVQKFSFMVIYENTTSWDDRIDLVLKWRSIVSSYPSLNATIWEVNSMFVDQMLSLKSLAFQNACWTLACMVAVCALFIQNPVSVTLASLAIASISLGTVGYLSFWDLDLDPVSLGAVLMSIGMSVDFTAHTTYHYQLRSKSVIRNGKRVVVPLRSPRDKLRHTVESIAWPMMQAALSTVICILPLVLLQNYIPLVFVKTISLVVIWGAWHGLVLLPACLAQVPTKYLDINCYRSIFRNSLEEIGGHEMSALTTSSTSA